MTDPIIPLSAERSGEERTNLTRSQYLMWMGQNIQPDAPLYNMVQTFDIHGPLDQTIFLTAFEYLVHHCDAMFSVVGVDHGFPYLHAGAGSAPEKPAPHESATSVEVVDLRRESDVQAARREWIYSRARKSLDLSVSVYDCALLRTGDEEWTWYLNVHHIATDAFSMSLVVQNVSRIYRSMVTESDEARPGEARPNEEQPDEIPKFREYVEYEKAARSSEQSEPVAAYWSNRLQQLPRPHPLYSRHAVKESSKTTRSRFVLGAVRSEALRDLALRPGIRALTPGLTYFSIFSAAVFAYMHRVTGKSNLAIGSPVQNRTTEIFKRTAGLFIEVFPLGIEIALEETFESLVRKTQKQSIYFLRNARPGMSSAALNKSFNVVLNYLNVSFPEDFAGMPMTPDWIHSGAGDTAHHLRLQIHDFQNRGEFSLFFDFNDDLFDAEMQDNAVGHFINLLDAFLADASTPIATPFILSRDETKAVFEAGNGPDSTTEPVKDVLSQFRASVEKYPQQIAIRQDDREVSFLALDRLSDALGSELVEAGAGPEKRVGIVAGRSVESIVSILAVLKTGAAYVPIDVKFPPSRIRFITEDAEIGIVLVDADGAVSFGNSDVRVIRIDDGSVEGASTNAVSLRGGFQPDRAAYIIYTSGSSGVPKGVMVERGSLSEYVSWAARYYSSKNPASFPLFTSLAVDLTVTSIFVPLVTGGTIVTYAESDDPAHILSSVLDNEDVDFIKLTPSHYSLVKHRVLETTRVKGLILGGESLRNNLARQMLRTFGSGISIYNEYGPTEATVGCMIHRYDAKGDDSREAVPIGLPSGQNSLFVLDREMNPVPVGVPGELCIAGPGLARGYLNQPELTAQRFVLGPDFSANGNGEKAGERIYRTGDLVRWVRSGADGSLLIEYIGREDDQVKIRGARIELGEVESVLAAHPLITQAVARVVTFENDTSSGKRYCARCGLESDFPDISFDDDGICHVCRSFESFENKAHSYFQSMSDLRAEFDRVFSARPPSGDYDCLMLLSGGKDSTYALSRLVEMDLRILTFTLDNGYISDEAKANIRRVTEALGVDHVFGETQSMNAIFVDSLERFSNVCQGCFKTIYTLATNLALEKKIPAIVTGLSRGQFFETRLTEELFEDDFDTNGGTANEADVNERIDLVVLEARKAYHQVNDAVFQLLDVDALQKEDVFEQVTYVDFYRYCDVALEDMMSYMDERLPWTRPTDTGRSTNCLINEAGIFVHKKERGYHNYAFPYSWDVRVGHKNRDEVLEELDDQMDETRVRQMLSEIGYDSDLLHSHSREKTLAAYYVASENLPATELRKFMSGHLPAAMVPTHFVRLDEVPLNKTGKIDRSALPDPTVSPPMRENSITPPRNDREKILASIWSDLLKLPEVGIYDNFFDMGGESLLAIRISARAAREGLTIPAGLIFQNQTIAELATAIETGDSTISSGEDFSCRPVSGSENTITYDDEVARALSMLSKDDIEAVFPLTPMQNGMLFHTVSEPGSGMYVEQYVCHIDGSLNTELFRDAWSDIADRHQMLRTGFLWEDLEEPMQLIRKRIELDWSEGDLLDIDPPSIDQHLNEYLIQDRTAGFDMKVAPLFRIRLFRIDSESFRFVWTFHHAILDGWSTQNLLKEVWAIYRCSFGDDPLELGSARPFLNHVEWLRRQDGEAAKEFWKAYLRDYSKRALLTEIIDSGHESPVAKRLDVILTQTLSEGLHAYAREHRLTLNTVFQAAWAVLLSRYTGLNDIVYGTTISGRLNAPAGSDEMVGLFLNTLPVRLFVDEDVELSAWMVEIQNEIQQIQNFDYAAVGQIQRWGGVRDGTSLFDSIVVYENDASDDARPGGEYGSTGEAGDITVRREKYIGQSNYPIALIIYPARTIRVSVVSNLTDTGDTLVGPLLVHYQSILSSIVANPLLRVRDVSMLSDRERDTILTSQSGRSATEQRGTILSAIEKRIREESERVAIVFGELNLTYGELGEQVELMATVLQNRGVTAGSFVGLHVSRSGRAIVGMLAILTSGAAYVPLDPENPDARLAFTVEDAGIDYILTDDAESVGRFSTAESIQINDTLDRSTETVHSEFPIISARDPAYVIYTSGTAGRPKGVLVNHGQLQFSTLARFDYYDELPESFLLLSPLGFDSSVAGVFWTLSAGGLLVVPEPGAERSISMLTGLINLHKVSHTLGIPALYNLIVEESEASDLSSLKTVIVAGESCPVSLVRQHFLNLPDCNLYNEYGPTETAVWASVHKVRPSDSNRDRVPIGKPVPGVSHFVLDHQMRLVPEGVPGELYVGGPGVADGYLQRSELTDTQFIPSPFSSDGYSRLYRTGDRVKRLEGGLLDFIGRVDDQVKIRGHRIELGEIERVIRHDGRVMDCAVITYSVDDRQRIAAFVGASVGPEITRKVALGRVLLESLKESLPAYMIPSAVTVLDEIPRTAHGKVDREALLESTETQDMGDSDAAYRTAPRNESEQILADLWADVLKLPEVGIYDNFFDLGGESILAIKISARAAKQGLKIPPGLIFENQTVADLVAASNRSVTRSAEQGEITGTVPLTPAQHRFFSLDLKEVCLWNQSVILESSSDLDINAMTLAAKAIVLHHDMLRVQFRQIDGQWIQEIQPTADSFSTILLEFHDLDARNEVDCAREKVRIEAKLHARLNIYKGPVVGMAVFKTKPSESDQLLLVAHHLVVDAIAWAIIVEDLSTAYEQKVAGRAISLPPKTTSFRTWSETLDTYAQSNAVAAQRQYWKEILSSGSARLFPQAQDRRSATVGNLQKVSTALSKDETRILTRDLPGLFNARINEILMAGFSKALLSLYGAGQIRVDIEGHGRESLDMGEDVSRTVGWFASMIPLILDVKDENAISLLRRVKSVWRAVPGNNLGYDVLRFGNLPNQLQDPYGAEFLFNYLGDVSTSESVGATEMKIVRPVSLTSATGARRSHPVTVNCYIASDQFVLEWFFPSDDIMENRISKASEQFLTLLRELIAEQSKSSDSRTGGENFSLSGLSQDESGSGTERKNIFLIAGLGGYGIVYWDLSQHLKKRFNVRDLTAPGLEDETAPIDSVPHLAAFYASIITEIQPDGPYHLIGYSFGGHVVFEIARHMENQKKSVGLLGVIDAMPPISLAHLGAVARLIRHARYASLKTALRMFRSTQALLRSKRERPAKEPDTDAFRDAELFREEGNMDKEAGSMSLRLRTTIDAHNEALRNYQPGFYPGRLVMYQASIQHNRLLAARWYSRHKWADFVSDVDVVIVEATHRFLIKNPNAKIVAESIIDEIDLVNEDA